MTKTKRIIIILESLVLVAAVVWIGLKGQEIHKTEGPEKITENVEQTAQQGYIYRELPWENGEKPVSEYSWAEFEALSPDQQEAFFAVFESAEAFEAWKNNALAEEALNIELPWENGGKPVSEYSWVEFEALSSDQQEAFFEEFESIEEFEKWMEEAQS